MDYTAGRGAKERLESLQSALLPDASAIIDAVRERLLAYMPKRDVDGLLEVVEERGFDAAAAVYAERGRESKRQWQDIAGRTYGIKVASDWRPDGWLADMDAMTTQQAEEAVTAAREQLAALHQVQAVTEAEAQQAAEAVAAVPGLRGRAGDRRGQGAGHPRRPGRDATAGYRDRGQSVRAGACRASHPIAVGLRTCLAHIASGLVMPWGQTVCWSSTTTKRYDS